MFSKVILYHYEYFQDKRVTDRTFILVVGFRRSTFVSGCFLDHFIHLSTASYFIISLSSIKSSLVKKCSIGKNINRTCNHVAPHEFPESNTGNKKYSLGVLENNFNLLTENVASVAFQKLSTGNLWCHSIIDK
jgi:hypothetical protein